MDLATFKQGQRQAWEEGDYRPVGEMLEPAARMLVDRAGINAGQRVLDVATGSGSVAIAAAQAGAEVVGVDITDAWFDEARRRAADAGVEVVFGHGDAEDLPVDDESFDAVLSSFGAIFAPRHDVVASELARACRAGGTVAFTAWTPGGANDWIFSVIANSLPSPPDFAAPSISWGDPDYVRERFSAQPMTFAFERPTLPVEFPSARAFESFILENSGPIITARRALEDQGQWEAVSRTIREAIDASNEAHDGTYRVAWDFLLAVGSKAC